MFTVGDKIVHPLHGAGIIQEIVEKQIDGKSETYYALKLSMENVVLFLPTATCEQNGVRPVCSREQACALLDAIPAMEVEEQGMWNRRYRENMIRIRSGDLYEVARIAKSLRRRAEGRGISTGDKKMLQSVRKILLSELSLALGQTPQEIEETVQLRLCQNG